MRVWRHAVIGLATTLLISELLGNASAPDPLPDPSQWTLDSQHFDASSVWRVSQGSGQVIAVVDTGVAATHPDLQHNVLSGADFSGGSSRGLQDTSADSHGTAVAAVAAASGGSVGGVAGLAPQAKILPIRVAQSTEDIEPIAVAEGIAFATAHGADIINVSLVTESDNPQLRAAVEQALAAGVIVVAAAGNAGTTGDPVYYPAAIPGVVAVGGVDRTGRSWVSSETGPQVSLAAPAVDIVSATETGGQAESNGTSFSAPLVSGALALIRSRYPRETAAQQIYRLTSTAHALGRPVPNDVGGYGAIDPLAALKAASPPLNTSNPLLAPREKSGSGVSRSPAVAKASSSGLAWYTWLAVGAGGVAIITGLGAFGWRRRAGRT